MAAGKGRSGGLTGGAAPIASGSMALSLPAAAARVTESAAFQRLVVGMILFAGLLVGLETHAGLMARIGGALHLLDRVVLGFFVVELTLRIAACGRRPWTYFRDPWNVFDFLIVAVCLLPFATTFAAVLRLARVLRVLRLVTALPRLQILVGALLKSVPSMGYVALLLSLHFYVYAVIGVTFFSAADPEKFGGLGRAVLTLFEVVTLEGWVDVMDAQIKGLGSAWIPVAYFVTFILLGTMIMLNLLIGVIVNGMSEAREETEDAARAARGGRPAVADDLADLRRQVKALGEGIAALQRRIEADERRGPPLR